MEPQSRSQLELETESMGELYQLVVSYRDPSINQWGTRLIGGCVIGVIGILALINGGLD